MTDPTTLEPTPARIELERGAHAQALLDNPLMAEALAAWDSEITLAWQNSPLRDRDGREHLRLMLEAAKSFRKHLQTIADTGKLRRVEIQRKQTLLQKVAGWK